MQKKLFLSLFLACAAAGNARAEILWQDDPQDIYASGFFWPAYDEYFQALPYEPSAADRLGRLWGIFAREAGSADTWAEWQGWQQAEQLYRNGQYREAFEAFLPLADNGNVLAQLRISEQYIEGKGVPEDGEHASMWYERASVALPYGAYPLYDAQMHVADAETRYQLGQMYSMGAGVRGNRKAAEIMQALAGEGFAKAMLDLSEMYDTGGALPTDPAQMFYWREQAATHGDASLQFLVAEYRGKRMPAAPVTGMNAWRQAGEIAGLRPSHLTICTISPYGAGIWNRPRPGVTGLSAPGGPRRTRMTPMPNTVSATC